LIVCVAYWRFQMSDQAERIRRAFDSTEPVTAAEARRRSARRTRARRFLVKGLTTVVALAAVVAVGLFIVSRDDGRSVSVRGSGPTAAPLKGAAGVAKSVSRDGITVRIRIDPVVVKVGGTIRGNLTISTDRPVSGCRDGAGFYELVLTSPPTGSQGGDSVFPPCDRVSIKAGSHNYRIGVPAVYGSCTTSNAEASVSIPACLTGSKMPSLPAGIYQAKLASTLRLPSPPAIRVTLTLNSPDGPGLTTPTSPSSTAPSVGGHLPPSEASSACSYVESIFTRRRSVDVVGAALNHYASILTTQNIDPVLAKGLRTLARRWQHDTHRTMDPGFNGLPSLVPVESTCTHLELP
jgi:hypothetical protein